ncbi:hypothetical protein HK098_004063 [Nowakowskiella sp. JEL0407]|nr:hypothetical protein HK098_004063 [Nowakowskiella sp. JEL0407]
MNESPLHEPEDRGKAARTGHEFRNSPACVLQGPSGCGKSFIAATFSKFLLSKGEQIAWILADSEENLLNYYRKYANWAHFFENRSILSGSLEDLVQKTSNPSFKASVRGATYIVLDNVTDFENIVVLVHFSILSNTKILITTQIPEYEVELEFLNFIEMSYPSRNECFEYIIRFPSKNRRFTTDESYLLTDELAQNPQKIRAATKHLSKYSNLLVAEYVSSEMERAKAETTESSVRQWCENMNPKRSLTATIIVLLASLNVHAVLTDAARDCLQRLNISSFTELSVGFPSLLQINNIIEELHTLDLITAGRVICFNQQTQTILRKRIEVEDWDEISHFAVDYQAELSKRERLIDAFRRGNADSVHAIIENQSSIDVSSQKISVAHAKLIAVTLQTGLNLKSLNLSGNINLGDKAANALFKALKINSSLKELNMKNTGMGDDCAEEIGVALSVNSVLENLNLEENKIGRKVANEIGKALSLNTGLQILNLDKNEIYNDGAKSLLAGLCENSTLRSLSLRCNKIRELGTHSVFEMLKINKKIEALYFPGNQREILMEDSGEELCSALETNSTLKTLDLGAVKEEDLKSVNFIGRLIRENTALFELDLTGNQIGDELAEEIAETISRNTNLKSLSLKGACGMSELSSLSIKKVYITLENNLTDRGAGAFGRALEINWSLLSLDLQSNSIADEGVKEICKGIKANATLVELILRNNLIGDSGAASLSSALVFNSTLITLDLSENNIGEKGAMSIYSGLESNRGLQNLNLKKNNIDDQTSKGLKLSSSISIIFDDDDPDFTLDLRIDATQIGVGIAIPPQPNILDDLYFIERSEQSGINEIFKKSYLCVLNGPAKCGKTFLAVQYANYLVKQGETVAWIVADSKDLFVESFKSYAEWAHMNKDPRIRTSSFTEILKRMTDPNEKTSLRDATYIVVDALQVDSTFDDYEIIFFIQQHAEFGVNVLVLSSSSFDCLLEIFPKVQIILMSNITEDERINYLINFPSMTRQLTATESRIIARMSKDFPHKLYSAAAFLTSNPSVLVEEYILEFLESISDSALRILLLLSFLHPKSILRSAAWDCLLDIFSDNEVIKSLSILITSNFLLGDDVILVHPEYVNIIDRRAFEKNMHTEGYEFKENYYKALCEPNKVAELIICEMIDSVTEVLDRSPSLGLSDELIRDDGAKTLAGILRHNLRLTSLEIQSRIIKTA